MPKLNTYLIRAVPRKFGTAPFLFQSFCKAFVLCNTIGVICVIRRVINKPNVTVFIFIKLNFVYFTVGGFNKKPEIALADSRLKLGVFFFHTDFV